MIRYGIVVLMATLACNNSDTSVTPSELPQDTLVPTSVGGAGGPAGALPDEPGACDIVQIDRKNITSRVEGLTLYLYVPATSTYGPNPYVDVWTENVNETKLGRGPSNEEFQVTLPGYGTWRIQLAVEIRWDGAVIQCDRHRLTVTARPPVCTDCDPPPSCPLDFEARQAACEAANGIYSFDAEECEDACLSTPPCPYDLGEDSLSEDSCSPPPPPEFSCADYTGLLCHATGTKQQNELFFDGIPPGHCKHLEFFHSPGQGPVDTLGSCTS